MTQFMHYFSQRVDREVKEIYWETFLANFALALVFIFEPIYLYTLSHSLIYILWFYVEVYVWYAILVSLGAKFAGKFGYKHSILLSNVFYVAYWICLYFIRGTPVLFYITPIFFALQKSFFWPAFDADIALHDRKKQRGREVGVLLSTQQLAFIVGPFVGGLVLAKFGFLSLFVLASIMMFASVIPLLLSPEMFDKHNFHFSNLWHVVKTHKQNFLAYLGFGEDLMLMSLWPVFIYLMVGNYENTGSLTAIAMAAATMIMLYVGKRTDIANKRHLIETNSIIYGLSWVFRFFANTVPAVLFFDFITKTLKAFVAVPVTALTLELASGKGADHAIAYTVFYEFSLAIAKVFMALIGIWILSTTGNIYLVFAAAGILTMFYGLLKK